MIVNGSFMVKDSINLNLLDGLTDILCGLLFYSENVKNLLVNMGQNFKVKNAPLFLEKLILFFLKFEYFMFDFLLYLTSKLFAE